MKNIQYLLLGCLMALCAACEEDTLATHFAPKVNTGEATDIYRKGATVSGSIQITGATTVKKYGIMFSELESMAEYEEKIAFSKDAEFSFSLQNLTPDKTYYYCSFAHSGYSTIRGQVRSFRTLSSSGPIFDKPVVSDETGSSFTATASLVDDGGSELLVSGFCYNEVGEDLPNIVTDKVENVELSNNRIKATIKGLEPNKSYQVRAYGISNNGVAYSETVRVKTGSVAIDIVSVVEQKKANTYSLHITANAIDATSNTIHEVGFCYSSTKQSPTINDNHISKKGQSGEFSATIENLTAGTTYYIRAYATNQNGTGYSETFVYTATADQAEVAYLCSGYSFNEKIKQLANANTMKYQDTDSIISRIEFLTGQPILAEGYIDVSDKNSYVPIYATYNKADSLITILSPAKNVEIVSASYLFYGLKSLRSIDLGNFKVSEATTYVYAMFGGCSALTSLDVSNWNTENVINMSSMFNGCLSLTRLDVSNWNTENVTSMRSMFSDCSALATLDTSKWDTKNVTDTGWMFSGCSVLTSLDVSNWNTENVTDMYSMFYNCSALTSLDVSNWNTENVTSMRRMFWGCSALTALDVSNWNIENVTNMEGMFYACSTLHTLNVSNWKTNNVTDMTRVFFNCSALTSLDVSNWNTENVTGMESMFIGCSALTSLDVSNWNTGNVTSMRSMFYNCSALTSLDSSSWDTSNVTDMYSMFYNCSVLTLLDVSNWNTENVTDMGYMFDNCSALTSLDVSNWNTENVTYMQGMFSGCSVLTSLDVSNWNTENVTSMGGMFYNCSVLTSLDVFNWNTENVTSMINMFYNCSSLTTLDVSGWNTENVTDMRGMFYNCSSLTTLDVSGWNTENVTDMGYMFRGCSSLTSLNMSNWNFQNVTDMGYMFYSCASNSKSCDITATSEVKELLLDNTSTTRMNKDYFNWIEVTE